MGLFGKKETINEEVLQRLANCEARIAGIETNLNSLRGLINRKLGKRGELEEEQEQEIDIQEEQRRLLFGDRQN